MKGYFSRIASQTGLRFSAQGLVLPRVVDERPVETPPAPLDREETVRVRPSFGTKSQASGALKRGSRPAGPAAETVAAKPDLSITQAEIVHQKAGTPAAPVLETTVDRLIPKVTENEPAEIVRTVYVNPPAITELHERRTQDPGKNAPISLKEPEKRTGKDYFLKTAEIIEGRVAEPVEVQTILLREIQEWVAAGNSVEAEPREERDPSVEFVGLGTERLETQEVESMTEPEPGIVRIGGKRHRESILKSASGVEEQSFDLSIGTISVVIEGNERPQLPITAPRAEIQPNGQNRGRPRSLLGRNYL